MSRTDDTPVRPITSKPIVRSDLARSWLIEAAKVLEQTGFEDEAWDIKTIAIKLELKIRPQIEKMKQEGSLFDTENKG